MKPVFAAITALTLATPVEAQERKSVAPKAMQAVAPGLAAYTDDVLFGDVWISPALSPRDRSLVTISVLIATGKTAQLTGHLGRAIDNGVKPTEIAGAVTHLAFYTGWPNAVSSLEVIEKVLTDKGVDMCHLRAPTGEPAPPRLGRRPSPDRDDDHRAGRAQVGGADQRGLVRRPLAAARSQPARPQPGDHRGSGRQWR
jgi:4-carboxymuconolactone decarboxylase